MINLNDIVASAHGGQGLDTLAARFGLTPEQTQRALDALLPAVQMALQSRLGGGAPGGILSELGNAIHQQSYSDPNATGTAASAGGSVLGQIFNGPGTTTQVSQQAATQSGVPASILQSMLPVIVSMVLGGIAQGAQSGRFGGMLSDILGSMLGNGTGGAAGGGLGGRLGSVLGGLFGGSEPSAEPAGGPAMPRGDVAPAPASARGTLDEISSMIEAGTPPAPEHEASLANILGR